MKTKLLDVAQNEEGVLDLTLLYNRLQVLVLNEVFVDKLLSC